jgi:MoaA/NifB/PqqE/SkfB family radical SAM enzyme
MTTALRRKVKGIVRTFREVRMFAKAMQSAGHPILAQVIPTRRCNLACAYCNEFDDHSSPVPTAQMLRRIDRLLELGTTIITLSGGEPTLHPDLDKIIRRIRQGGVISTLITNGLLLTPEHIRRLNRAGLDYLQISIDNVVPDETSKKSLKALDKRLSWLAEHAEFAVSINSVVGSGIRNPADALRVAKRAHELGFPSTLGIIHDDSGQLRPLETAHQLVVDMILRQNDSLFSFAHYDRFQERISRGLPIEWHCRAGGRYLYVCEDGLVHYCSQQCGRPGIPLETYSEKDLVAEAARPKPCAPMCTVSCVHQTAMLDSFRESPREALAGILERRRKREPGFEPPVAVRLLSRMFIEGRRKNMLGKLALNLLGIGRGNEKPRAGFMRESG